MSSKKTLQKTDSIGKPTTGIKHTANLVKKSKEKSKTRSSRAELLMPVARVHRHLKRGRYAERVGSGAPVYMAAVLEYLASEVLELAGNAARDNKKKRITPRMITLALRSDEELSELVSTVVIAEGGVVPNINAALLKPVDKKPKKEKAEGDEKEEEKKAEDEPADE
jgi:histone H2A